MSWYLAQIIDDEGDQAATRIMTSSRQDAARAKVREALIGYDDGLYVGLVKVWDTEDKDDPGTLYGWEAIRELPEGFDEDDEELDVDVKLDDRSLCRRAPPLPATGRPGTASAPSAVEALERGLGAAPVGGVVR